MCLWRFVKIDVSCANLLTMQRTSQTEKFTQKQQCCSPFCFDPNILGVRQAPLCSVNQNVRASSLIESWSYTTLPKRFERGKRRHLRRNKKVFCWFWACLICSYAIFTSQSAYILMVANHRLTCTFKSIPLFWRVFHTRKVICQLKKSTPNNAGRGVRNCASILLSECVVKSSSDYYCTTKTSCFLLLKPLYCTYFIIVPRAYHCVLSCKCVWSAVTKPQNCQLVYLANSKDFSRSWFSRPTIDRGSSISPAEMRALSKTWR